jgi:hypothetical protein
MCCLETTVYFSPVIDRPRVSVPGADGVPIFRFIINKQKSFTLTHQLPLVLDLRIAHDRVGSNTDPNLNGHLKYPNNFDQSLNDATADKVRKHRADYNNRPPSVVSFIPAIASTSDRLYSEFVRLLFLQAHRETDHFYTASGVLSAQSDCGLYHCLRAAVSAQTKSKVGLALVKEAALRITLDLDGGRTVDLPSFI